jgi:hypothetical protein
MERIVIGSGGYGCAIWPALIFANSVEVNQSNDAQFVTKLASDAQEEYDTAKIIQQRLRETGNSLSESVGIFPVDPLVCGIKLRDLDISENDMTIIEKCKESGAGDILEKQFNEVLTNRRIPAVRDYRSARDYRSTIERPLSRLPYAPRMMQSPLLGGDLFLCGIQYPKYLGNIDRMYLQDDLSVFYSAVEKLSLLHSCGVYHLDIKIPNLCYFWKRDVRFADWGLSCVNTGSKLDTLAIAVSRLSKRFVVDYYVKLCANQFLEAKVYNVGNILANVMLVIQLITNKIRSQQGGDIKQNTVMKLTTEYGVDENIAAFFFDISDSEYKPHYSNMLDLATWKLALDNVYEQVNQAFRLIDYCLLASAFIQIQPSQEANITSIVKEMLITNGL